ncbi:hypothetical protein D3C83_184950 [compost metagenome]
MFDQAVDPPATRSGEADRAGGGEKLSHLSQREMFGMLHGDLHSLAVSLDPANSLSGSSCVGNTPPFRIILHWTTL